MTTTSSEVPWYLNKGRAHPFVLTAESTVSSTFVMVGITMSFKKAEADMRSCEAPNGTNRTSDFQAVASFPWKSNSLETLWGGGLSGEERAKENWEQVWKKWSGVYAVGGGSKVRLFLSRPGEPYLPLFSLGVPDVGL